MIFKKSSKKAGLSPGTLLHVGERKVEDTKISIMDYDEANLREMTVDTIEELRAVHGNGFGFVDQYFRNSRCRHDPKTGHLFQSASHWFLRIS